MLLSFLMALNYRVIENLKQEDPSPSLSAVIGHRDLCDPDNCSIDYVASELFSLKM